MASDSDWSDVEESTGARGPIVEAHPGSTVEALAASTGGVEARAESMAGVEAQVVSTVGAFTCPDCHRYADVMWYTSPLFAAVSKWKVAAPIARRLVKCRDLFTGSNTVELVHQAGGSIAFATVGWPLPFVRSSGAFSCQRRRRLLSL